MPNQTRTKAQQRPLSFVTFLDIEASGLKQPDSYPIEIGWADTLGNSDAFLIRPLHHWTYWDKAAEWLHGITREQLLEEGISVDEAAWRLDEALGVETIYCDALAFDGFWVDRLFEAAGFTPSFQLADVYQLYGALGSERSARLLSTLESTPPPHRAREDAKRYAEAYCAVIADRHQ